MAFSRRSLLFTQSRRRAGRPSYTLRERAGHPQEARSAQQHCVEHRGALAARERLARRAERPSPERLLGGAVQVSDKQELLAKQRSMGIGEVVARRERHEAQCERREPLQRHRSSMCGCDECGAVAERARDTVDIRLQLQWHRDCTVQSVRCTALTSNACNVFISPPLSSTRESHTSMSTAA